MPRERRRLASFLEAAIVGVALARAARGATRFTTAESSPTRQSPLGPLRLDADVAGGVGGDGVRQTYVFPCSSLPQNSADNIALFDMAVFLCSPLSATIRAVRWGSWWGRPWRRKFES
jgi:hypothetical protein